MLVSSSSSCRLQQVKYFTKESTFHDATAPVMTLLTSTTEPVTGWRPLFDSDDTTAPAMGTAITRHCSHPVYMNPPYEPLITLSLLMSNTKQHGHLKPTLPPDPDIFNNNKIHDGNQGV